MKSRIQQFLDYKKGIENRTDFTLRAYRGDLDLFFGFLGDGEPTQEAVAAWLGQWASPATKSRRISSLKAFFKYLVMAGAIEERMNPMRMIRVPRLRTDSPIDAGDLLTEDESVRFFRACGTVRDRAIVKLAVTSGLRARELLSVRAENLDFTHCMGTVKERSGERFQGIKRKSGPFRFSGEAATEIAAHMKQERIKRGRVFRISYDQYLLMVKRTGRKAGIAERKLHPHIFRHMWATYMRRMVREGRIDILTVQKLSGWSRSTFLKMWERYSHLTLEEEDEEYRRVFG